MSPPPPTLPPALFGACKGGKHQLHTEKRINCVLFFVLQNRVWQILGHLVGGGGAIDEFFAQTWDFVKPQLDGLRLAMCLLILVIDSMDWWSMLTHTRGEEGVETYGSASCAP